MMEFLCYRLPRQKQAQGVMRAFDVGNHPAFRPVHDNKVQRGRAARIVEGDGDMGLAELLSQNRDRDRAGLPARALHEKIIGFAARRRPGASQAGIECHWAGMHYCYTVWAYITLFVPSRWKDAFLGVA